MSLLELWRRHRGTTGVVSEAYVAILQQNRISLRHVKLWSPPPDGRRRQEGRTAAKTVSVQRVTSTFSPGTTDSVCQRVIDESESGRVKTLLSDLKNYLQKQCQASNIHQTSLSEGATAEYSIRRTHDLLILLPQSQTGILQYCALPRCRSSVAAMT